uniref:Peptidase M20 dimerisation domain-containing protein n=1 Tax=Mucochytrium quahogii TaxID=96639 RepID=A0A7S2WGG6_9STRA|mmetsp:Transcript_4009/g.5842  ORF Transcript_4009/g.5842 Transcript_4009/m.5842 type:complete len:599 (+) Transcript_4009:487-2283(+)|eukprot:CAMPEP_0203748376 /NCGR_PEP_ID=MMETSP0098-20131031/3277_1 /ASSEMBLY_ACC=CAM_ASM_000208 /TAXON_ID=96639 /ORGANISM=" , Strain NY0313808BC1" /LENGTH=598 /DNA_ID=CAMNT_0050637103 /DNA_START=520 /DNA_END=2316 /DNA_ORIENTATION=-
MGGCEDGPRRMHHCWVCAEKEEVFGEPSVSQKAMNALQDANVCSGFEHTVKALVRITQYGVVMLILALAMIGYGGIAMGSPFAGASSGGAGFGWRTCIIASLTAVVGLVTILGFNTMRLTNKQVVDTVKCKRDLGLSEGEKRELAEMLSRAIQFKTISYDKDDEENQTDHEVFSNMHDYLEACFPLVHSTKTITKSVINDFSLLYEWKGTNPDLAPVILMAHMDVVPTPNASKWSVQDPFGGVIDEQGTIWGRGAIDNKHNVITQLAAVEHFLKKGVKQLERTFFFSFGHDEEIGGVNGARHVSEEILTRLGPGRKAEFILDEGPFLVKGVVPGYEGAIGFIGNREKGSVSAEIKVDCCPPGHSSMPPPVSNIGILSEAIQNLEKRPFSTDVEGYFAGLQYASPSLPWWFRVITANPWLFSPLLKAHMLKKPATAASTRTTTAVTILRSGAKINVLPGEARAWINHRIHPKDKNIENVLAHDRKAINDKRVTVSEFKSDGNIVPSPISPVDSNGFMAIRDSVARCFKCPVMPCLMPGNTDTRWFWNVSDNIYRFTPIVFEKLDDTKMFHGIDERISTDNLVGLLTFYVDLVESVGTSN